jgi:S1-C subfamily serine protease
MTGWVEATAALRETGDSRDKRAAWQAAIDLLPWLSDIRHPVEPVEARRLLWQGAIQHRWFDIAELLASAMASRVGAPPALKRLHAQMLLERGFDDEALARLDDLRRDAALTDYDREQVLGHLGRIHKDRFVAAVRAADGAAGQHLSRAIEAYRTGYEENPGRDWLGINAVALLAREEAAAVRADAADEARRLAVEIQANVERRDPGYEQFYSPATVAEAQLALGDAHAAVQSLVRYVQHPQVNGFALGGTLRQFTEIWRLDRGPDPGPQIVNVLRAAAMEHLEGAVKMSSGDIRRARAALAGGRHEAVFGPDRFESIENYGRGLERSASVARIGRSAETGVGTGFLLPASLLGAGLESCVLVTNAHVLSRRPEDLGAGAVHPDEAVITFAALRGVEPTTELGIAEVLFESPPEVLDVVVARLTTPVAPREPLPIAKVLPQPGSGTQVRVIGHPSGRGLSFSSGGFLGHQDPRLHYRAATEGGSSGSPVFNADWRLVGLHHAGGEALPKLNGEPGTYEANEGITISAIAAAMAGRKLA